MERSPIFQLAGIGRTFIIHGLTRLHTCGYYSTSASNPSSDRSWCVAMVCRIKHFSSSTYAICRPSKRLTGMVRPFLSGWINLYLHDHGHYERGAITPVYDGPALAAGVRMTQPPDNYTPDDFVRRQRDRGRARGRGRGRRGT